MDIKKFIRYIIPLSLKNIIIKCVRSFDISPKYNSEIEHWKVFLKANKSVITLRDSLSLIFPPDLRIYIEKFRLNNPGRAKLSLLEVGSGPVSMLASAVYEDLCDITAVDPLAEAYDILMKEAGLSYPVSPVHGMGEELEKLFGRERFDIIYSSNALDHVRDPFLVMRNMRDTLKPSGIIFLEGYVNEGYLQSYSGLHKFDIYPHDGRLFCKGVFGKGKDLAQGTGLKIEKLSVIKARERSRGLPFVENSDNSWYTAIYIESRALRGVKF